MSALEEFHIRAGGCDHFGDTREQKTVNLARAAIAELENRLKAAEAMSADAWRQVRIARDSADKAEAENERLRVCGTCAHHGEPDDIRGLEECEAAQNDDWDADHFTQQHDPCQFTPSRWTPYWEDE